MFNTAERGSNVQPVLSWILVSRYRDHEDDPEQSLEINYRAELNETEYYLRMWIHLSEDFSSYRWNLMRPDRRLTDRTVETQVARSPLLDTQAGETDIIVECMLAAEEKILTPMSRLAEQLKAT
jgi:hypothetical protein